MQSSASSSQSHGLPRFPGIIHRCLAVNSPGKFISLLTEYLDYEKKPSYRSPAEAARDLDGLAYCEAVAKDLAPQRPGIDFLPDDGSRLRMFGHIEASMRKAFPEAAESNREQFIPELTAQWLSKTGRYKKQAVHLVFSMDPKVSRRSFEQGLSDERAIFSCAAHAMAEYRARFYSRDSIGWIGGVHRDRAHTHLHALVFPQTASGKPTNLSRFAPVSVRGTRYGSHRIDYQGALKAAFAFACEIYTAMLFGLPDRPSNVVHHLNEMIKLRTTKSPLINQRDEELRASFMRHFDAVLAQNRNQIEPFSWEKDVNRNYYPKDRKPYNFADLTSSIQPIGPIVMTPAASTKAPASLPNPSIWAPPAASQSSFEID